MRFCTNNDKKATALAVYREDLNVENRGDNRRTDGKPPRSTTGKIRHGRQTFVSKNGISKRAVNLESHPGEHAI